MNRADISQITFKSVAIILELRRRCSVAPSAGDRWPDFGHLTVLGSPFDQFCRNPDTPYPVFFTLPLITPVYTGTGLGRRSSIKAKIFRNKFLDIATSANWNVT